MKVMRLHPYAYYFYHQGPLIQFWSQYKGSYAQRRVLFIYGAGFDPRCIPALRSITKIFYSGAELETFCVRFTNLEDKNLITNQKHTSECLKEIWAINSKLKGDRFRHNEVEVKMFSETATLIGDELLMKEFKQTCGRHLGRYTDVIVDITAFPRTLMFALLSYLWRQRKHHFPNQNLFAVLTETPIQAHIEESYHKEPTFMWGGSKPPRGKSMLWIPVLGGEIKRFEKIYNFLKPLDILPIIPFPARNPRLGDDILLKARHQLFDRWDIPFTNVMYASGDIPFDVFRKIQDLVLTYRNLTPNISIVVSALSGRSLSLGVLLAALWSKLYMCHVQPTTYRIDQKEREKIKAACLTSSQTIYWLDGELYNWQQQTS